jgi:hypothetical protein
MPKMQKLLFSKQISFEKHRLCFSLFPSTNKRFLSTEDGIQYNPRRASKKTEASKKKVLIISGPTGTGKSSLGIELAKKLNGEIISGDSIQVYKGLNIGAAKVPIEDRQGIPHYLMDIISPREEYNAGLFKKEARILTEVRLF